LEKVDRPNSIPNKRYFSIGEVSKFCDLKPHVLRYWENEFPELSPIKRRGNRRYYRIEDINLIKFIKSLLYEQGYTINGAKSNLLENKGALKNILAKGSTVYSKVLPNKQLLFQSDFSRNTDSDKEKILVKNKLENILKILLED
tara:strand:- start:2683 stop:3114 length:432 start_codon:yes stop_codon:yes gene_type:complete